MKKILATLKTPRRKYKRYAVALASAAILAGTALPGIPMSIALASEAPTTSPPIIAEQNTLSTNDQQNSVKQFIANKTDSMRTKLNRGWHEHMNTWPSSGDNHSWYENGHIYYSTDNDRSDEYNNTLSGPIQFVKEYASLYGFDPDNDAFTLLSVSNKEAVVQVVKQDTGQRFKIELENRQDWRIIAIRGIGDTTHPATYQSTRTLSPN